MGKTRDHEDLEVDASVDVERAENPDRLRSPGIVRLSAKFFPNDPAPSILPSAEGSVRFKQEDPLSEESEIFVVIDSDDAFEGGAFSGAKGIWVDVVKRLDTFLENPPAVDETDDAETGIWRLRTSEEPAP